MATRRRPADPQVVAERNAEARAAERERARDPERWGLSAEIKQLPTSADVTVVQGARGRVLRARRQDTFRHLLTTGSLNTAQYWATERYLGAVCASQGVRTHDTLQLTVIDGGGAADLVTQRMIDAGALLVRLRNKIGRADMILLEALVRPMLAGDIRVWRVLVKQVTGETERHCQAGSIRRMAENLRLAWEEIDEEDVARRKARREARGSGPAAA
ncbi:MAG TPA: hypothetical protein VG248_17365 [Caulobacteraceae bacterium]|jgi:hypothetical protein|nr:hypothetical protein [Caulobacteraceae bacterium]